MTKSASGEAQKNHGLYYQSNVQWEEEKVRERRTYKWNILEMIKIHETLENVFFLSVSWPTDKVSNKLI